jgi:hypothetical protein
MSAFFLNMVAINAEPLEMCLLGVRTLAGFGVVVDAIAHRLLSSVTIVAGAAA